MKSNQYEIIFMGMGILLMITVITLLVLRQNSNSNGTLIALTIASIAMIFIPLARKIQNNT